MNIEINEPILIYICIFINLCISIILFSLLLFITLRIKHIHSIHNQYSTILNYGQYLFKNLIQSYDIEMQKNNENNDYKKEVNLRTKFRDGYINF